jgi:predicted RecB family nuclease
MLYDYVSCEHRPWMDLYADREERDDVSPFLELLWRRQRSHEEDAIANEGALRLDGAENDEVREAKTIEAMRAGVPLIYHGRIVADDLAGEPDLLRLENGKYVPGDIKAGAGEEGDGEDRKPKKRYAVQLALYVDVLERLGFSDGKRRAFVWDVNDDDVPYDLTEAKGKRTPESLWDDYQETLHGVREIVAGMRNPGPAYQGECKHCVWYGACMKRLEEIDDLTLLPGFGRSRREGLVEHANSVGDLARLDPTTLIDEKGKSRVKGIGADWVLRFHERAVLKHTNGTPYLRELLRLPEAPTELFFDIETDPGRNLCYLHGFVERNSGKERYEGFFTTAATPQAERESFAEAMAFVRSKVPFVMYIYSKYERTWWRSLQKRYPDVCTRAEIDELFDESRTVDLLAVVQTLTEWPTKDHTIKTIARYLGFDWRDAHPSGFASIEWYDRYITLGDVEGKTRILEYNEDDCVATRALLDGIRKLSLRKEDVARA